MRFTRMLKFSSIYLQVVQECSLILNSLVDVQCMQNYIYINLSFPQFEKMKEPGLTLLIVFIFS